MRIAQLAPPLERVPPAAYGGTERLVWTLTEELVARGHDVTLFASGDSVTSARLAPIVDRALWHAGSNQSDFTSYWVIALGKVAARLDEFDLVHNHLDFLAYPLSRLSPCPVLTTLHGRLDLPALARCTASSPMYPWYRSAMLSGARFHMRTGWQPSRHPF